MGFQIQALNQDQFSHLFTMTDIELRKHRARRITADSKPGYPCRISLMDADIGDTVILVHYQHLDIDSPYAASHAIYGRESAKQAHLAQGEIPDALSSRHLSIRAFDANGLMQIADLVDGAGLATQLETMLADPAIIFVYIHHARQGCFAARAYQAETSG